MNFKRAVKILEIDDQVSPSVLKTSFRKLALKYHPDRNLGDIKAEKKFRDCLDAYNFLVEHIANFSDVTEIDEAKSYADKIVNLDNVFDDIFGFSSQGRILGFHAPQNVELPLTTFVLGLNQKMTLAVYELCPQCEGKGSRHQAIDRVCSYCFGRGSITAKSGNTSFPKKCTKCKGRGRVIENPCLTCDGFGKKGSSKKVDVHNAAGFWPGETYTWTVKDFKGKQYEAFVHLTLPVRTFFHVENGTLVCHYPVTSKDWQTDIEFPTPWGWHRLKISDKPERLAQAGLMQNPGTREKSALVIFFKEVKLKDAERLKKEFLKEVSFCNPYYGYVEKIPWYKKFFT
ncbi:DnaJ domain-containing protein [bacterium]|nr:DnaJ domain-containing protein [bacterium]